MYVNVLLLYIINGLRNNGFKLRLDYYYGQGRYDVCCPMMSAWDLHKAWPEADLKVSSSLFQILSVIFCKLVTT